MEITCSRCHQTVGANDTFCPACGLPQLLYAPDIASATETPESWPQPIRDAGSVDWKVALKMCLALAIPSGMLCSLLSPLGISGLILMVGAGTWAVALYMRSQRPAWITIGAGARIGLVTGLMGGWVAVATTGLSLFGLRYWMHQGGSFDNYWQTLIVQQMSQQWTTMGVDPQTIAFAKNWMLSPEGRAGWILGAALFLGSAVLLFGTAGGALGARFLGRPRRKAS